MIEGFNEAIDMDGDLTNNLTGEGVTLDETNVNDITFVDVNVKFKNDTEVAFEEADLIL